MGDQKMIDLTKVPGKDLRTELKRREEIEKSEKRQQLRLHREIVMQHVDTLLLFVPDHDHTSCNDESPINSSHHARMISSNKACCNRCELLFIKSTESNLNTSVRLDAFIEEDP